jgi:ABC-type branched-subunit amino acid transport system substrate-binding protein
MKISKTGFRFCFLAAIVFFLISNPLTTKVGSPAEPPLLLPMVTDLTGPYKTTAAIMAKVAKAQENYINETGGIRGRKVNLEIFDCRFDVGVSTSLLNRFVALDPKPPLIWGGVGPFAIAAHKKMPEPGYRIPVISPAAYTQLVQPPMWFFSTGTLYTQNFGTFIDWILRNWKEKRAIRVAFFNITGPGGQEALRVKPYLEKRGVEVVAEEYAAPVPVDLTPTLLRFEKTKPDYIYGIGPETMFSKLASDMHERGIKSTLVLPDFIPFDELQKFVSKEAIAGSYQIGPCNTHLDEKAPGIKVMNEVLKKHIPGELPNQRHMWPWLFGVLAKAILEQAYDKTGSWDKVTGDLAYEIMTRGGKFSMGGITSDLVFSPTKRVGNTHVKIFQYKNAEMVDISGWLPISKELVIE